MTEFRSIDARTFHLGRMARRMREDDAAAAAAMGVNVHAQMHSIFNASAYRKAWMIDGSLAAIGGVIGTLASSSGFLWLLLSKEAQRHPRALVRDARRHVAEIMETYTDLTTTVTRGDEAARRFATHFGFRLKHPIDQHGPQVVMEMRRDIGQRPARRDVPHAPFIIYAQPRSRTAWLANFLTYDGWQCGHEDSLHMRDIGDLRDYFSRPRIGAADTAAAPGWHVLRGMFPAIKPVVIRRPVETVVDSLVGIETDAGLKYDLGRLRRVLGYVDRLLDDIGRAPGALVLDYEDLDTEAGCRAVFEHCLPYHFDRTWWRATRYLNVQADVGDMTRYLHAHRDGVDGFKLACWSELRKMVAAGYRRDQGASWQP